MNAFDVPEEARDDNPALTPADQMAAFVIFQRHLSDLQ